MKFKEFKEKIKVSFLIAALPVLIPVFLGLSLICEIFGGEDGKERRRRNRRRKAKES